MECQKDLLTWVRSQLHTATVDDVTKDFCDGTVLMELAVLLVKNEAAVSEALEKFTERPTTMFESLENIRGVMRCLGADPGTTTNIDIKPLDVFRGKSDVIVQLLQCLRTKYGLQKPMSAKGSLSKQDITDWARTVCEHTDSLRKGSGESPNLLSDHSDHDTGFIDHTGSAGSDIDDHKPDIANDKAESRYTEEYGGAGTVSPEQLLPEPRPQDESYSSIDIIEVDEKLVRADSKIILSSGSNRRACVYVSIPMRYEVTDLVARDSFLKQATKNYVLAGCEVPLKELQKLGLGYAILLATCSYARSLRTQSVGIYSPFLLGLQTINIAEKKQLFAHVLRNRVLLSAQQKPEHVKLNMKNISKTRIQLTIPEGTVWQQQDLNGDSALVTREAVVRTLYPEETEIISIPALYLNKHAGKCRGQALSLTPFVFRGPLNDQEKLFNYSDPGDKGYFRFCNDCNGIIYSDMYGVVYHENRPFHLECGPSCQKCGLNCLTLHLKENRPYCSLECYYLSQPKVLYCEKCGYVLSETDTQTHRQCPKQCKVCEMLCFTDETRNPPLCSRLCQDWDSSKSTICQGCAQPITKKSTSQTIDKMLFHSVDCFKIRTTAPPLILQRAMVRGKDCEVTELRRLTKIEFGKRSERRRDALRLRKEERERTHKLDNVMDCINKIAAHSGSNRKYATQPRKSKTQKPASSNLPSRDRSRSLGAGDSDNIVDLSTSRKRANVRPPDSLSMVSYASSIASRRSLSDTGSFLDLLFSSDDEEPAHRPCRQFSRSLSESMNKALRTPINYEKKKLNRGFPTGQKHSPRDLASSRQRAKSADSDSSVNSVHVLSHGPGFNRSSRRFMSLRRSTSKGSTGSTSSSTSVSPTSREQLSANHSTPRVEFERPDLFLQLRCEKQTYQEGERERGQYSGRFTRHHSAPTTITTRQQPARRDRVEKRSERRGTTSPEHTTSPNNPYPTPTNHYNRISPTEHRSSSPTKRDRGHSTDGVSSRRVTTDTVTVHSSYRPGSPRKHSAKRAVTDNPTTFQRLLTSPEPATSAGKSTNHPGPPAKDPLSYYMSSARTMPIFGNQVTTSPEHTRTNMTEAQLRYERRFSRNRSQSGGESKEKFSENKQQQNTANKENNHQHTANKILSDKKEEHLPSLPEPPPDKKYSLELLNDPAEQLHRDWTSPRLADSPHRSEPYQITSTITLPGSTDMMEIGEPEPLVGLRLSTGNSCTSVDDISLERVNLNTAQTVV